VLQLFVSGMSPRSTSAIRTIKALCEELLAGQYTLEIVDLYDDPHAARAQRVLASPTLIRQRPLPVRRLIGDLSDRATVLRTLGLV
jgi:circadian clock protein KaiB